MDIVIKLKGNTKVSAEYKGFSINTDQPVQAGGENSAPSPFDLFLASIGTCAGFYIQSFCNQRGLNTGGISIVQKLNYNREEHRISSIEIEVKLPVGFPEKYKDALINSANACTVKKHLLQAPEIKIVAV